MFYLGWPVSIRGTCTAGTDRGSLAPEGLELRVSPNPGRYREVLRFGLPQAGDAKVEVYDVTGRCVVTLADGRYDAGWHTLRWGGRSAAGEQVAPGVYFVRLTVRNQTATSKLILIK
jgi:hypothetical protein